MPLLMTKIEGKGNGIKTVIPNMSDVARALSRPPTYPTKFFGCELGAQTSFDEKNDRYIVNGAHQADRMRELLDGFIEKFVLCKSCKNPETDLIITKTEEIIRDCKACGQRTGVDMRHKLTTFILKNPPKKSKKAKGNTAEAAQPDAINGNGHANGDSSPVADDGGESDDELSKRIKAEAAELNAESSLAKDDWSQDTSEDAVKARMLKMGASMGNLNLGDDSEGEDEDSPYAQLSHWVSENREVGAVAVFKKIQDMGLEKKHKAVQVLVQSLFTEDIVQEISTYAPVFAKVSS
jgi:translation initiation factor 5